MAIELALYQPDIPQNSGTLLRLGACLNVAVHIIHPTGFAFSDKLFRRSAMDYADHVQMIEHNCFDDFYSWCQKNNKRLVLMSTKASQSAYEFDFASNDILMAGRESAGVPQKVADASAAAIRIPMSKAVRSINVSIASAMVLGEALKQTGGFEELA